VEGVVVIVMFNDANYFIFSLCFSIQVIVLTKTILSTSTI